MKALRAVPFEAVLSVNREKREKSATLSTKHFCNFYQIKGKRRQCASQFYFILFPPPSHPATSLKDSERHTATQKFDFTENLFSI